MRGKHLANCTGIQQIWELSDEILGGDGGGVSFTYLKTFRSCWRTGIGWVSRPNMWRQKGEPVSEVRGCDAMRRIASVYDYRSTTCEQYGALAKGSVT